MKDDKPKAPKLHMPTVEVRRVNNGWVVLPPANYSSPTMSSGADVHVFREWAEASKFISAVTLGTL